MKRIILFILIIQSLSGRAQQKIFSENDFLSVLKKFHPVMRQAALEVEIAEAGITAARSGFDPVAQMDMGQKELEGSRYYSQRTNEIRIPTWYGIDLVAGSERISGDRINPENTEGNLSYAGFSIPLLRNLVMDKRRAELLMARQFHQQSKLQREIIVNDIFREGLKAYWSWWEAFQAYRLSDSSRLAAEKRLQMVRTYFQLGERPAIDTIEASTQVQYFLHRQNEAAMFLEKSRIELSGYLWKENHLSTELPADVQPQTETGSEPVQLEQFLLALNDHPEIRQYEYKLNILETEKKLKFQMLLPALDLKYNQLGKEKDFGKTINSSWFQNNYRFGFSLSVPLRLSQGRGEYRQAKFKLEQTRLEQVNKTILLSNKLRQHYTEWKRTGEQMALQQDLVQNYLKLQQGEELKFRNGESSLFLLNARELKTMESKEKLIQIKSKNRMALVDLKWSAAVLE